ncbi:FtsX-like permease family protein [Brevundimonas variabilis]|uniref:Putative lysophospholipase L1 biosynthesis ABC-type transport system permease subunit n=1 Tax=Brevundimonas variabilis TaxID=74312 RepID=A0A7W9CIT1_9CAUL|nr:putative lysophospholipase L1 biosynthesis ABC-type transport system permease subunit [Brevundimonas variabilis]
MGGRLRLKSGREGAFWAAAVNLTAPVAGGLGVAGAVSAYLDERKRSIATLKALGAEGALVRDIYLIQISALAALGGAVSLTLTCLH